MSHQPNPPFMPSAAIAETLEVWSLGLVDFESLRRIQERLVFELSGREDRVGYLLLCEHPPVITMGREASRRDLQVSDNLLDQKNIGVHWVPRGGGAMAHGPGQLGIYALLPTGKLRVTPATFRQKFETAIVQVCRELRVPAKRKLSHPGVWSRGGQIAMFGAAVRSEISCYGMYLNVHPRPEMMDLTSPTAGTGRVTSLQAMTRRPMDMAGIRSAVACQLAQQFNYGTLNYSTPSNKVRNNEQIEALL